MEPSLRKLLYAAVYFGDSGGLSWFLSLYSKWNSEGTTNIYVNLWDWWGEILLDFIKVFLIFWFRKIIF